MLLCRATWPDQLTCAGHRWDVPTGVATAWLLAEGTAQLLTAEQTDPLDWRHTGLPRLDLADPTSKTSPGSVSQPGHFDHVAAGGCELFPLF